MDAASDIRQAIARLTPLADVLAAIDTQVQPVAPRSVALEAAGGRVLAEDLVPPKLPKTAIALIDGWALAADATQGAGGYSPALLPTIPTRVEVGQSLPHGTDSVAPFDDVKIVGGRAEVLNTINPGDGVLPAGGDCEASALWRAGERVRAIARAALAAAGITRVSVREARIVVVPLRASSFVDSAADVIARDLMRRGAKAEFDDARDFSTAVAAEGVDAVVAVGGTGQGRDDKSVQTLANAGRVVAHGVGLSPGETTAFGFVGSKPVLLLPGRLDAALAAWLTLGRRMLARLSAHDKEREVGEGLPLARKVASTVGMAELVAVRRVGGQLEPLASKYLSLTALTRSDGWILVPAESEGYSAGSTVQLRAWP
jgi:molybdopterin molybdotransferase